MGCQPGADQLRVCARGGRAAELARGPPTDPGKFQLASGGFNIGKKMSGMEKERQWLVRTRGRPPPHCWR